MQKVYEVLTQKGKYKKGDLILEEDITSEKITELLESGVLGIFKGELMFDNSSTASVESF